MEQILLNIVLWFGFYAIVNLSLSLEYGLAGIPNFGRAFAVLMGAFAVGGIANRILMALFGIKGSIIEASGSLVSNLNAAIAVNPTLGIALLIFYLSIAALIGAIAGALAILPSARLSRDYLAITMLAISEVSYLVLNYNTSLVGGYYGVSMPYVFTFYAGNKQIVFAFLSLLIAFAVYLLVNRISNSPFGRLLRAMREDEDVVRAYGRSLMVLRIKTSAIAGAIAALAGALYSLYTANVIASNFSRIEWTFYPFLMILLGGAANCRGVLLGTSVFIVVKQLLIVYKHEIVEFLRIPFETVWVEYVAFGLLMFIVLLYKPEGLLKEKPLLEIAKKLRSKILTS